MRDHVVATGFSSSRIGMWLVFLTCAALAGCSGDPPEPAANTASTENSKPASSTEKNTKKSDDDGKDSKTETVKSENGKKWIGDIPYDVWFDNPLEIVNTDGEIAANTTAPSDGEMQEPDETESTTPESSTGSESETTAASGELDWGKLLPMPVIDTEIKLIRNTMNGSLQSVSQYNSHYKELQVDGALLAAIATIMPNHPESPTWKPNAKHVRDLGNKICGSSTALGKKAFDATKESYERLVSVLDGNLPPDLEDVPDQVPFADAVSRGDLMKRMQISYDWMKKNIPAENVFMEQGEKIRHEASLLATMGTIIASEGYSSTDEEEYKTLAKTLVESCGKVIEASNGGQYDAYNEALSAIYKSCTDCHVDYRGE